MSSCSYPALGCRGNTGLYIIMMVDDFPGEKNFRGGLQDPESVASGGGRRASEQIFEGMLIWWQVNQE